MILAAFIGGFKMAANTQSLPLNKKPSGKISRFIRQLELQSMVWPGLIFLFIFCYIPMYGIVIAFKEFKITDHSFFAGQWQGLKYFMEFFNDEFSSKVILNTLGINTLGILIGFPITLIFALFVNELANKTFKRITQTISYLPHFISWAVFGGIVIRFLSTDPGLVNDILVNLKIVKEPVFFLGEPKYFWFIAIFTGIAKELGWSAIIYLAAITGIDKETQEAAVIDGAGRFQRMWYVSLPSITGTIVIMLILSISNVMSSGFDQIYMLGNKLNSTTSEVIDTYVYKMAFGEGGRGMRLSYAAAVGLFKSVVAFTLLIGADKVSKKITEKGIF